MKKIKLFSVAALSSAALLVSCGGGGSTKGGGGTKRFTSRTGWKPNDQKGWFFTGKQERQKSWPGMVYVDGGTFTMGQVKDDILRDWNNTPRRMEVSPFYIGETEITNYEYREYVTWLKYVFPPTDPNFKDIYSGAMPDTLLWDNKLSRNDFADTYFRAPEFDYYPVVGVSWLQASRYCDWLTDRANEKVLMDEGVLSRDLYVNDASNNGTPTFTLDKYRANDPEMQEYINEQRLKQRTGMRSSNQRVIAANLSTTSQKVTRFRLPTEAEWEFAALGMEKDRNYNNYLGKDPKTDDLRGTKGRNRGMFLENFKYGPGDYSGAAGWKNDGSAFTSDVRQYPSNDLGIYGMFGNVAEWTADVYRPIVDSDFNDFNYYRGNAPQQVVRNADGTAKKVEPGNVKFDTLADGRLVYRNMPGQFERQTVADYRNYRDGDFGSSLEGNLGRSDSSSSFTMYNSPKMRFRVDGKGRVIMEKDPRSRTSQMSNDVRVVKGGSWMDTAYWLDPGQRRFRNEAKSYSWVGFRVAQDAKADGKRRTKR